MEDYLDSKQLISPYNIIFSCDICQRTVSDIYPDATLCESSGDGRLESPCKLWVTECTHLTCSEHLEGGGAPFHAHGSDPMAACPLCLTEKADHTPKKLFSIYGPGPFDHDPRLPVEWFSTPPMKLDDGTPKMSALRFQYLALVRYGVAMHSRLNRLKTSFKSVKQENSKLSEELRATEHAKLSLSEDVEGLKIFQSKYLHWKKREPEVKHYLGQFTALAKENALLKSQLSNLGYQVPRTNWVLNGEQKPDSQQPHARDSNQANRVDQHWDRNGTQSHTQPIVFPPASRDLDSHHEVNQGSAQNQGRKRGPEHFENEQVSKRQGKERASSSEIMPPPPPPRLPRPVVERQDALPGTSRQDLRATEGCNSPMGLSSYRVSQMDLSSYRYNPETPRASSRFQHNQPQFVNPEYQQVNGYEDRSPVITRAPTSQHQQQSYHQRPQEYSINGQATLNTNIPPALSEYSQSQFDHPVRGGGDYESANENYHYHAQQPSPAIGRHHPYQKASTRLPGQNYMPATPTAARRSSAIAQHVSQYTPARTSGAAGSLRVPGIGIEEIFTPRSRRAGPTLNSLSFINTPYTTHNQPMSRSRPMHSIYPAPYSSARLPENYYSPTATSNITRVTHLKPAPAYATQPSSQAEHTVFLEPYHRNPLVRPTGSRLGLPTPADSSRSRGAPQTAMKGPLHRAARSSRGLYTASGYKRRVVR
ncbi:hypothetical protein BT63DRAFT_137155 [Microthyrium microscopicum]|uniref:Uncharacterized protein n=1 Tax=Microthyrium microscopicum TaxID=703497 RepID=A0A6A6UMZ3_9PEZI|nr:hypothetical protein BT63DRAFT_137155 [Microthyrium microscopicum]